MAPTPLPAREAVAPEINESKCGSALFAGSTRTRVGFKSLPSSANLVPALIEHFDESIDNLQQSARIGLNGCQGAKLSPVFFVDSHVTIKARTWPNPNATPVEEAAIEAADAKRVAAWALVTPWRRQYENISRLTRIKPNRAGRET
jgi:hypothetical protein